MTQESSQSVLEDLRKLDERSPRFILAPTKDGFYQKLYDEDWENYLDTLAMHEYAQEHGLENLPHEFVPLKYAIPIQEWVVCPGEYKETE